MENENLNTILIGLRDVNPDIRNNALNMLIDMTKSSHSGSISTLTFQTLMDKKEEMLEACKKMTSDQARMIYDIISAISIMGNDKELLEYRIKGNVIPLKEWGHLYVKKLIGCIVDKKTDKSIISSEETNNVIKSCIEFLFRNNLEFDAIDFLLEIDRIIEVKEYVEEYNYKRIILYLEEMASFYDLFSTLTSIYLKMKDYSRYVIIMVDNGYYDDVVDFVEALEDKDHKMQLLYILGRLNIYYDSNDLEEKFILSNLHIKDIYRSVIKQYELDVDSSKISTTRKLKYEKDLKSIQQNNFGPITVCNGFMNLGYGQDMIFFPQDKEYTSTLDLQSILNSEIPELVSILGSVGCIEFWNPGKVLEVLQEHIFGETSYRKTGSLLALALSSSKIFDENQTVLSLLANNLQSKDIKHVIPTLLGIQSIYCNTGDEDIKKLLMHLLYSESLEISCFTAFTLGSIFVGTGDDELISIFLQMYIEKESNVDNHFFKLLMLGLALLFYRRSDLDCCLENMGTAYSKHGAMLIKGFQHIKTGNSKVVEYILSESFSGESDALLESLALLSCTIIGIGDEVASQMISRICTSSLLLESLHLKSLLPLCYSLLYPSQPNTLIIDALERNIHGDISDITIPSLYALGIIGAGTVSGRIQKILDAQYSQIYKDSKASGVLRVANGLVSLGKGMSSISVLMYDKTCIVPKNFIGLFATTLLLLEPLNSPMLSDHTYLFYLLNQSFTPKYIYTKSKISVRIGLPVNTVGIVGDPRRITSMQTHTTPVILNCTERAEIDEPSYTSYIEDVVLLKESK